MAEPVAPPSRRCPTPTRPPQRAAAPAEAYATRGPGVYDCRVAAVENVLAISAADRLCCRS